MEKTAIRPFEFKQCTNILKSTGQKACNIRELREGISVVGEASLFHHGYQYFLKGHTLEYTNDFAHWAGEALEERALAERLANIDPYSCKTVDELRVELLREIDEYLAESPEPREAMSGDEFYFGETVTFTFPAGVRAKNLAEFLMAIKYIDPGSIYYHFYQARVRLGEGVDDFSKWLDEALGKSELAVKVRSIDLFMHTVEGIRGRLSEVVENELRKDMEVVLG